MLEISLDYRLTESDFIEAEQMQRSQPIQLGVNLCLIILCGFLAFVEFKRIGNPNFFIFEFAKKIAVEQIAKDHILNVISYMMILVFWGGQSLPKFNPIYRKNISKRYQNNFVKQEDKTITIDETEIKITSANYREIRQWQSYNDFAENKKIFLLFRNQQSNIVPKRIFETEEELNLFRTMLANKIKPEKSNK